VGMVGVTPSCALLGRFAIVAMTRTRNVSECSFSLCAWFLITLIAAINFWATVCKTVRPMLSDRYLSCPVYPVLSVTLVYCGQTVRRIQMKLGNWHAGGPRPWPHCVRLGPSSPSPKEGGAHQFSAQISCSQMAGWIKMPLGIEVGLVPGDFVLEGDPAPLPKKG